MGKWTPVDIELLKKVYTSRSREEILRLFPGKTWEAVAHKSSRLRVGRVSVKPFLGDLRMKRLSKTNAAYLAGLVDGEGTLTISAGKLKGLIRLRPIVIITTTSEKLREWLSKNLPGYTEKRRQYSHWGKPLKTLYAFQIARLLDVNSFLLQIGPYLVIKQEHCGLLLEYCRIRFDGARFNYDPRLFDIAAKIRELNRKSRPNQYT